MQASGWSFVIIALRLAIQELMVYVPGLSLSNQIRVHALDALGAVVCRHTLLPPMSMRRVIGATDFDYRGEKFLQHGWDFMRRMQQELGFAADCRFFDLGSGCGQYAIPLTGILNAQGSYAGLEVVRAMVRWCRRRITRTFPNFHFLHADVYNAVYNHFGKMQPQNYSFPVADAWFDVVFSTSVFTHLPPAAVTHYLAESARILKPGGKFFSTFFLIESGTRAPDDSLHFQYPVEDIALSHNAKNPEWAIAYRSEWVLAQAERAGLRLLPPLYFGSWTGRKCERDYYQDALFLEKQ
jgi:SAM-dependent methyltransferase